MLRLSLLFLTIGLFCLAVPEEVRAQPGAPEPPQPPPKVEPETEEFKNAVEALRAHLKKMREVVVRFNVGDASEDLKWKEEWIQLQSDGVALHQAMLSAGVAEYRMDPKGKKPLGEMLFRVLKRNIDADRFEGMVEVAQALMDADYPEPDLRGYLSMSAYALGNYDVVKTNLDQLVESGGASPQLLDMQANFDQLVADWQKELRVREQDAQGEPLPRVLIKTTKGNMEVELFENQAPETVGNFIHLVESGFYEHLSFHRVLQNFMAQGGCPDGDGTGGPGYTIYGEMKKPGARKFFRGTLGMALAEGNPDSGGSQFFITFLPATELNGDYTAFGRVIDGIEVLANIQKINPDEKKEDKKDEPAQLPDEILEIEVLYKRGHEYEPHKVQ